MQPTHKEMYVLTGTPHLLGDILNGSSPITVELDGDDVESKDLIFTYDEDPNNCEIELTELVALESSIEDLTYLLSDIKNASGMNQSFALEAERLLPGFNSGVSINSYSKETSSVRYVVSLEDISKGIWALIAASATILIGIIIKIFGWFSGNKEDKKSDNSKRAVDKQIEGLDLALGDLDKLNKDIRIGESVLRNSTIVLKDENGNDVRIDSFQTFIDKFLLSKQRYAVAKRLLEYGDKLFHDIIVNGPYSKAMFEIGQYVRFINDSLTLKIDLLDDILRDDLFNAGNKIKIVNNLKRLEALDSGIEIKYLGRTMSISEASRFIMGIRTEVLEKEVHDRTSFDDLYNRVRHVSSNSRLKHILVDIKHSLELLEKLNTRITRIEDASRDMSVDGTQGAASEGVGSLLRHAVVLTAREISAFGLLIHQIKEYAVLVNYLFNTVHGFTFEIVRKLVAEMDKNNLDVPPELRSVVKDLSFRKSMIREFFYRANNFS